MQKIITLFQRNYGGDHLVRDEVTPGAEWVVAGEGVATRKYDGTCCLVHDGALYKRYDLKPGRTAPEGFEPAQGADAVTGHHPGWVPVGLGPEDAYHREAWAHLEFDGPHEDGTYELVGPKVQGGAERDAPRHMLIRHADAHVLDGVPRTFAALRDYLTGNDIEGVVWHHPDGRMVKIKGKDFGIKRRRPVTIGAALKGETSCS